VLGADPDDSDAWVARLVATDLGGDASARLDTLMQTPESPTRLSPLSVRLVADVLERVVGPEARQAWEAAQSR
jgi:hypothetical protein